MAGKSVEMQHEVYTKTTLDQFPARTLTRTGNLTLLSWTDWCVKMPGSFGLITKRLSGLDLRSLQCALPNPTPVFLRIRLPAMRNGLSAAPRVHLSEHTPSAARVDIDPECIGYHVCSITPAERWLALRFMETCHQLFTSSLRSVWLDTEFPDTDCCSPRAVFKTLKTETRVAVTSCLRK